MPTAKKIAQVAKIRELVKQAGSIFFVDFSPLSATDISTLRRRLRKENIRLLAAKNRLLHRALRDAGIVSDLAGITRGPTSVLLGPVTEPYMPGRLLRELLDSYRECRFKGAYVEQRLYLSGQFEVLAAMPTCTELRTELSAVLMYPLVQLLAILDGQVRSLTSVLEELAQQRETPDKTSSSQNQSSENAA